MFAVVVTRRAMVVKTPWHPIRIVDGATDDLIAECLCFLMRLIFKGGLYLICYEFSAASIRGRPLFKGGLYQ